MRAILLVTSAATAILAGTSLASAWDDPPGWRWQNRENVESQGRVFHDYRGYGSYGYGGDYAYAPGPTVVVPAPGYYDYGYSPGYYRRPGFGFRIR